MKLSLIIPAYNEEKRLSPFLDSIIDYTTTQTEDIFEVIIIDDGSSDDTFSLAQAYASKLPGGKVIRHKQNKGKGGAIQTGVKAATGDVIVFMDADGATPITELPHMILALQENQVGIGNRWLTNSHAEKSTLLRHFAGWVYKTYMSMFGLGGIDTMCGFKGYQKDVADKLFTNLIDKRWLFDAEIAYKAVRNKYTIKNFPIEWHSVDGSKLSSMDLIKSALGIFPLIQKVKQQYGAK